MLLKIRKEKKMVQLQVTLFDKENRYKPVSTLVNVESIDYYNQHVKEVKQQAIIKICQKRYWTQRELKKYNFTSCKVRIYDKEKIEKENKERYEKIKKERGWK